MGKGNRFAGLRLAFVVGTLVPEPTTVCLLLMGSFTLIRRRRR